MTDTQSQTAELPKHPHVTLGIEGMSCASCVRRVENALTAVPGVTAARVNLASESADVDPGSATVSDLTSALEAAGYPARIAETRLRIEEMSCASCVGRVQKALAAVPGVISADVNLASESAALRYVEGMVSPADLMRASAEAGYPAHLPAAESGVEEGGQAARKAEEARILGRDALIAFLLGLPVFLLAMGTHMVPGFARWIDATLGQTLSWTIQALLTTAVLAWPGRRFFLKGYRALFRAAPDMNALVALGTTAAWGYSMVALLLPGLLPADARHVYFEAAAMIVVLILLGRMMEARAKGRTGAAIARLVGLQPRSARVERDGETRDVPLAELMTGDIFLLRPGEKVPSDAEVISGSSFVDESMITGEPVPVTKGEGDVLTGGTVNRSGALRARVLRVGEDTTLSQIIRLVEQAQGARLPIQSLVDRVTAWFVPGVMLIAVLTVAIWLVSGAGPAQALVAGVAVLIIACPCAMGLATPVSIMVGSGRAADLGVLFRQGDALQSLAGIRAVAFDKTGTLTEGRPALTSLALAPDWDEAEALRLAASAETTSEHPLAEAIVAAARARDLVLSEAVDVTILPGRGLSAVVDGRQLLLGSGRLMEERGIATDALSGSADESRDRGETALFLAVDGQIAALAGIADPVRPGAAAAVEQLKAQGLAVAMVTGDNQRTADAIGARLGLDRIVAEVLPEGKVRAVEALQAELGPVAFAGDGINDAPALAAARVGVAMGGGTDVAIESADVVLMSGDPRGLVDALAISRATLSNIRQNLFWAFGYNVILIPVAAGLFYPLAGVMLSPMLAAAAMGLSSVFVLSNALRLRWLAPARGRAGGNAEGEAGKTQEGMA